MQMNAIDAKQRQPSTEVERLGALGAEASRIIDRLRRGLITEEEAVSALNELVHERSGPLRRFHGSPR